MARAVARIGILLTAQVNRSELLTAIFNTLAVSAVSLLLAVPVGCVLAVLLLRTNLPGQSGLLLALGSQLAVPLYVLAGGWGAGFGLQGWIRSAAGELGGWSLFGTPLTVGAGSLWAVSAIHAFAAIPWVCLICSLGLLYVPRAQEELALLEGGWWQLLRHSLAPRLPIWLAIAGWWCIIPVFTEMVVTNLYQVPTVAEQVYLDASRGGIRPLTYIAATLACMLPILMTGARLWRRLAPLKFVFSELAHARGRQLELAAARWPLAWATWLVVLCLVAWPLLNLFIKAGWQPKLTLDGQATYGWSVQRLGLTVYESLTLYREEMWWSGLLGILSSSLALCLASSLGFVLTAPRGRVVVSAVALLLLAVPGPMVGMLIIAGLNRSQPAWLGWLYDTTLAAPLLAQQFRLFPLAWLLALGIFGSISPRVQRQARLEGLSKFQWARCVVWPQTWRLWSVALLMLFAISVGELSCTILVLPPGVTTLSMRIFEMLHFGMRHQDSGLCGLLILLGWGVAVSAWKTLNDR